ncbi:MAG TPA: hypothetical protein VL171_12590 [Verrucomicrobiae bacterium]|nr:hypothetical protein [Verrucomicrobiae bacterium]
MDLALEFGNGRITGEGNDDIGPFVVDGRYGNNQLHWTKTYVGSHELFYEGFGDGKGIRGAWELKRAVRGGFRIWPLSHGACDDANEAEAQEQPIEAITGRMQDMEV